MAELGINWINVYIGAMMLGSLYGAVDHIQLYITYHVSKKAFNVFALTFIALGRLNNNN